MLNIYGSPLSSPTNKVRYVAAYLKIPFEFHLINLGAGEHRQEPFLKINPFGRVPAIDDDGFKLAESNAICRYLAGKVDSPIYPKDIKQRALVDEWIDFASFHVMLSLGRIMFNTHFFHFAGTTKDERSIIEGHKFLSQYLPIIEAQLSKHTYIVNDELSLADIVMLASLDVADVANIDLNAFNKLTTWRNKLMTLPFYTEIHKSYTVTFTQIMERIKAKSA